MRAIVDTNVLVSGIFFAGPPYEILNAWRHSKVVLVVSADILDEYRRVGQRLSAKYPGVDIAPILALIAVHGEFVEAPRLRESVCEDPSDDKFFACAVASGCRLIISGDKHLHRASGYSGIEVFSPREFVEKRLAQQETSSRPFKLTVRFCHGPCKARSAPEPPAAYRQGVRRPT